MTATIFDADPVQYAIFLNNDYGNSRGIEMGLKRRYSNRFEGSITYTYSKAEGNSGNEFTHWWEAYSASVLGTVPAQKTITLPWDQPHMLNLLMDYRSPSNWGINIIGSYGSGLPYTATDSRGRALDERNSSRLPATLNMDVRLNKDFNIGRIRYRLYSDILNFFNRQNVNSVFSTTGKPNESANPNSSIEIQDRPEFYAPPRSIEVGIQIYFR
ncbi:MAG: TonB-dependent receptor [Candidatus Marinimicrobia bacterium]|nr:TonB-dependent receptor [Candidatus Neomarinimicrobiota bacterium]